MDERFIRTVFGSPFVKRQGLLATSGLAEHRSEVHVSVRSLWCHIDRPPIRCLGRLFVALFQARWAPDTTLEEPQLARRYRLFTLPWLVRRRFWLAQKRI